MRKAITVAKSIEIKNKVKKIKGKPQFTGLPFMMTKEQLHILLKRYRQGLSTPEELELLEFFDKNLLENNHVYLNEQEEELLMSKYKAALHTHIRGSALNTFPKNKASFIIGFPRFAVAASIVLSIASAIFFVNKSFFSQQTDLRVSASHVNRFDQVITNADSETLTVDLPDGTKIILEPGATVKYSDAFALTTREVLLEGVAFFEVTRDESRPFLVYAGGVVTKVLGTSFTISATPFQRDVTVLVKTGKVSVHKDEESLATNMGTIVTPNQKAIFNTEDNTLSSSIIENPEPILSEAEVRKIRFTNASASEIFKVLQKVYGIEILFDAETFDGCALRTSITEGGIFNRLDIICNAIGARYSVEGTQIKIEGPGCKR